MKEEKKSQEEILYNFFYTLFKRKYVAVAVLVSTFAGIIFGTYLVTPLWMATAKVRVQYNPKQQLTMFEGITTPGSVVPGVNPANDVIQMVTSRELAEEVVKKYGRDKLVEQRETAPQSMRDILRWYIHGVLIDLPVGILQWLGILTPTPDNYLAVAVDEFQEDLTEVGIEEDTTVVNVSIWGESPEMATNMANTLVDLLLEMNYQSSTMPIDRAIRATEAQLLAAEENLAEAQANLRDFKEKSALVLYKEEAGILLQRLDRYTADLNDMEGKMAALRTERSASHPEVKSLDAQIKEYRNVIIPDIKAALQQLPLKEVELQRLEQERMVRQELYSRLKQKLLDLEALKNSSMGDLELKVIDDAMVYSYIRPDWPKWIINIPLGLIASVFVSLGFVFFVEYWNSSFKSVKEMEESFTTPVLGSFPMLSLMNKQSLRGYLHGIITKSSRVDEPSTNLPTTVGWQLITKSAEQPFRSLERYDAIADALQLDNLGQKGKVFLVTSAGQGEGKSTISAVLGHIFANRGKKVLIVEANLRTPVFNNMLPDEASKGLLDYCLNNVTFEDVVAKLDGVDIIPAGEPQTLDGTDSFEVVTSERMGLLLKEARNRYDIVFLDSSCIKRFKDSLAFASMSDDILIVVEANHTLKRAVQMVQNKIKDAGGRVRGLILNKQINYVPEIIRELIG